MRRNVYVPNTSTYLATINAKYGTNYTPWNGTDNDGNLCSYQFYCPDGTHPYSDVDGKTMPMLYNIYVQLLLKSIN